MRGTAILALACVVACHKADRSHAIAARAPAALAVALPQTYMLRGQPADPQVYPDRDHCLEALKTMAVAMDVVANGSSAELSCVPARTDLATAVNNQGH
jgi:hypothetical protein